jgi:hypothetical protein
MKIAELREALRHYDADVLRELAAELYKAVAQDRKTEQFDQALRSFKKGSRLAPPKAVVADFNELSDEVETFLLNASEHLYIAPNRTISKARRAKWRFEVRRLVKGLIAARGEDGPEAAKLLWQVYNMLCYACGTYIFPTENPFSAIGYTQSDFLSIVLGKWLVLGATEENIEFAVWSTLASELDRDTYYVHILAELVGALKTNPARETARQVLKGFPGAYDAYQRSRRYFRVQESGWALQRRREWAAQLYLMLSLALWEVDEGIAYYNEHYGGRPEVKLYVLLSYFLSGHDLSEYWLREYEAAVARGVEPRRELSSEYTKRLAAQETPAT